MEEGRKASTPRTVLTKRPAIAAAPMSEYRDARRWHDDKTLMVAVTWPALEQPVARVRIE